MSRTDVALVFQKLVFLLFAAATSFPLRSQERLVANSRTLSFDQDWRFYRGDRQGAEQPAFKDAGWRRVTLPHDWSIEDLPNQSPTVIGPFSKESPGATATGYTVGGTAWYRKAFVLPANHQGSMVSVLFDGSYMNTEVWINGHYLGIHPYGYTAFGYDLTPHLNRNGNPNVLAVRVRNKGKNSRWYSGSGLYRHVWLTLTAPVHIPQWGVFVTTPEVSKKGATVNVATAISNKGKSSASVTLHTSLLDPAGKVVAGSREGNMVNSGGTTVVTQVFPVSNPQLWAPQTPVLYKAKTVVFQNGKPVDSATTPFGIRSIRFDPVHGFRLNGEKVLLRGGCVHHDNGPLGAAAIDRAEERKVELLKAYGFNAVRSSHNPPSQSFLEACDRLGMLVIDEAFDMWELPKNPQDYHLFFRDWWRKDLQSMVLRDRNHPSVILWSIGNEIRERADSTGLRITKQLKDEVYRLDGSRPVTESLCGFWEFKDRPWDDSAPAFALLDVGGYNYEWKQYEPDHQKYPDRIMLGTESFAREAFENWQAVEQYPWVIGDFVWTAMDYMGETAIGHAVLDNEKDGPALEWPWFNAYCGDIDLIGGKKPQSYYRDVVWRRKKITMAVHAPIPKGRTEKVSKWGWPDERQSWNWPVEKGRPLQVSVYTRSPAVRLELNGKVMGEKRVSEAAKLTAVFDVPYEAGTLKAFALEEGRAVDSAILATTGAPARIRLVADRPVIQASTNDLCYVTVQITDSAGTVVPDAEIPLRFSIEGSGTLAGVGNGNPTGMSSFQQPLCTTFRGRCLVILRPEGTKGKIILKAEGEGLAGAELIVQTK